MTVEQLEMAREWIADCTWGETDDDPENEWVEQLTVAQVVRGIERNFCGGVAAFIECVS